MTEGVDLPGIGGIDPDSGDEVAGRGRRGSPAPAASRQSLIVGYSRAGLGQLAPPGAAPAVAGPDRPAALPILAERRAAAAGFIPLAGVVRRNRTEVLNILLGGPLLQRNPIGNLLSLDYQLSIYGLPAARFGLLTRIIRTHAKAS